jgi:serine/threonine protein kinase
MKKRASLIVPLSSLRQIFDFTSFDLRSSFASTENWRHYTKFATETELRIIAAQISMALNPDTKLGAYEIVGPIGACGMGEVYKARDIRLNRTVAIKVLASHFSDKPEMKARFDREPQTIAGLNHPHICVVHDVGRQDGTDYLVMEYLEGQTLAQRLDKGGLPLHEAPKMKKVFTT